jgi:hypothetical protein
MIEPTKRDEEVYALLLSNRGRVTDLAAYREELLAASAQSAEPQEAEAVLRRYIKGNSPIDWDRIKPLIDAYAVARLASKPSRDEEMRTVVKMVASAKIKRINQDPYPCGNRACRFVRFAQAALAQGGARDEGKGER